MNQLIRIRPIVTILVLVFTGISLTFSTGSPTTPARAQEPPQPVPDENIRTFLPLLHFHWQRPLSIFGAETHSIETRAEMMDEANLYWVRNSAISWAKIEPVRTEPPTYEWDQVDEAGLREAAAQSLTLIATIKDTPDWAQKVPGAYCGAIRQDRWMEFGQFIDAVVKRYSIKPYRVNYWEFGNEPDVDPNVLGFDSQGNLNSVFGCWGDEDDDYYGGGYYATALSVLYPAVKQADADAKVMIGGLLLDCDPTYPPPPGKSCKPSKFFEGILRNNGAAYFDIVSFHSFANYNVPGVIDEMASSWDERGGVLFGKINFLREVMSLYGVNKPLLLSESALVCPTWYHSRCDPPVSGAFLEKQSDYISWLYVRTWASNLMGAIWYTVEDSGWQSSGLTMNGGPKPAYYALQFTAQELAGAQYTGVVTPAYPGIEGYAFSASGKRIWVLWAADQLDHVITLPPETTRVMDKYGTTLVTPGSQVTVNSPIYVELSP